MKATIKSRFSLGMKIVGLLSCLAIVSVGFAAWWIINYPGEKSYETGSFTVYAVNEKDITFTDITAEGDATIVFGAPEEPTTISWLGYTDVAEQKLSAILKFTVAINTSEALSTYLDAINVDFNPGAAFSAVDAKYVGAPKVYYQIGSTSGSWTELTENKIPAPDTNTADVYLKFDFSWGSATKGENPYNYFNELGMDDAHESISGQTNKQVAKTMLQTINGLSTNNYSVKITAAPKTN